jgi:hypothetical protein
MLKLTGFDTLLAVAGNLYLLLALAGVCLALWRGKTWLRKGIYAVLVLAAFIAPLVPEVLRQTEFRNRQATAQSMFEERCKTAGEKIHKTVEGVDGIYLMKLRPSEINYGDQFKMDDPYGHDSGGEMYLQMFLHTFQHQSPKQLVAGFPPRFGYRYIEAQDPKDEQRYRYTGRIEQPSLTNEHYSKDYKRFVLDKALAPGKRPRYGVTYNDISTHEEREYWIAGSSLKVIDLETNEVIGERIGYMMDWAQGSRAGGRSPWLFAADNACPDFNKDRLRRVPGPGFSAQAGQTLDFVEKVLKPSK